MVGKSPCGFDRRNTLRRHLFAVEGREIRPARDDNKLVGLCPVRRRDLIRRVLRIGDDEIARRHNAVIELLERRRCLVGAVIGRDERRAARSLRSEERAPGRCAAARMNEPDIALANECLQAARVSENRQRVLRCNRQLDELGAGDEEFAFEAPTFTDDNRLTAGGNNRAGDVDRRALRAARVELRDNLEDGQHCGADSGSLSGRALGHPPIGSLAMEFDMQFQIEALPEDTFQSLFALDQQALAAAGAHPNPRARAVFGSLPRQPDRRRTWRRCNPRALPSSPCPVALPGLRADLCSLARRPRQPNSGRGP